MTGKYMAYVGSYSYTGKAKGITVYDVDVEEGRFIYRCEIEVSNSSYVQASRDGKTLYSITDDGVVSFRILENGSLSKLGNAKIKGMRGCHLSTSADDKYIFVSGYHDGKVTVLKLNEDGSVGRITDGVYHKGLGSVAERNFRPHVSCSRLTPTGKFLMVADLGIDQIKIYRFDRNKGTIALVDAVRCELESAPRRFLFSRDGRFMYVIYELRNVIDVFTYQPGERTPIIEKIQIIPTTDNTTSLLTAACAMRFSPDEKHLFCTNAGDNTITMYDRDEQTGLLKLRFCLPVSGDYPKDIAIFPDGNHLASINHEGGISFFRIDYEKGLMIMSGRSIEVDEPNSCEIVQIGE
ncbi:MAG: lactonase family protein [Lachnospiraceae bacterium]|jgi:6-phosphogluconolactonase|nr:lactonase family protein [Lachnospiraceae bacterium]